MNENQEGKIETTSTTTADRRGRDRHQFAPGRTCQLVTWPDCRGRSADLFDVSIAGIAFILDEPLRTGKEIIIRLPAVGSFRGRSLSGKVAHVMPHSDGRWRIGCALCRSLSEAEINAML